MTLSTSETARHDFLHKTPSVKSGHSTRALPIRVLKIDPDCQHVAPPGRVLNQVAGNGRTSGAALQTATSTRTISGGTPIRTGRKEHPSPPETIKCRSSSTICP